MGLSDEELLDLIQRKAFDYFVMENNPKNGLVQDRAHNFQKGAVRSAASIAATGFGLTAYGVGVERGWMDRSQAYDMVQRTLEFFLHQAPQEHGFFYHFLNMDTGARVGRSELSPIDTSLFLAGAFFAAQYFDSPSLKDLTKQIYERVDWDWMLHGGRTLALAWSPEGGFHKARWDHYSECLMMYLFAIGSPTHPIPASSWQAILRPVGSYQNYRLIQMPPLFTHQYSHIWIDFRNQKDGFADYFKNSVNASLANRAFCIRESNRFQSYGPDSWGLTASDGPFGYRAYGAPPGWALHDGTVAPTASGGSIVFTPRESLACLRHFYEDLGEELWGEYGFSDAFNLDKQWFDQYVIGIDQGALLLMIENYRSELIWNVMKQNNFWEEVMKRVGFQQGTQEVPWPDPPEYRVPYIAGGIQIDGYTKDWPQGAAILLDQRFKEVGMIDGDEDLMGSIRFAWDENVLYFLANITDDHVVVGKTGKNIWQDDLLELFIDPGGDGLYWYQENDFQIGFCPHESDDAVEAWSWFQGGENPLDSGMATARGYVHQKGYVLEGAVRWNYLHQEPRPGSVVSISPAIHDIDRDRSTGKLQWFFRHEEEFQRFVLGKLILEGSPNGTQN
ncbi:MAG: hypothetical protein NC930_02585 [Candidatus Omnitrophica bacterium]|nr:hypothetical protein [Candidatus Omnitrophota bacterium]